MPRVALSVVLRTLYEQGWSIGDVVLELLKLKGQGHAATPYRPALVTRLPEIIKYISAKDTDVQKCVFECARTTLCMELNRVSKMEAGLHGNASNASLKAFEHFNLETIFVSVKKHAPFLHALITGLTDPDASRNAPRRKNQDKSSPGGDQGLDIQLVNNKSRSCTSAARMHNLAHIKAITIFSILIQHYSSHANLFQTWTGLYLKSCGASSKLVRILAHAGFTISLSAIEDLVKSLGDDCVRHLRDVCKDVPAGMIYDNININFKVAQPTLENQSEFKNMTTALFFPLFDVQAEDLRCAKALWDKSPLNIHRTPEHAKTWKFPNYIDLLPTPSGINPDFPARIQRAFEWHLLRILRDFHPYFKDVLQDLEATPGAVFEIPVHETKQYPAPTMDIDESTLQGNADVIEELYKRGGLDHPDLEDQVTLLIADLSTVERIQGVQEARRFEDTSLTTKLQRVVTIPGALHYMFACADAWWRTYIQPKAAREGDHSPFTSVGILRPKETGKIASGPAWHTIHSLIVDLTASSLLDCCRLGSGCGSLEEWIKTKPSLQKINQVVKSVISKHVAGIRGCSDDRIFNNQSLFHRDGLLYLETYNAMRRGDTGRLLDATHWWIPICAGVGKHKYTTQLHLFITNLARNYPEGLRKAIMNNWLINPSGKPNKFRGGDESNEILNLKTKINVAGQGPNRTVENIKKNSPLIEVYGDVQALFDDEFHNFARTSRHSSPNNKNLLSQVRNQMMEQRVNEVLEDRGEGYAVVNALQAGYGKLQVCSWEGMSELEEEDQAPPGWSGSATDCVVDRDELTELADRFANVSVFID